MDEGLIEVIKYVIFLAGQLKVRENPYSDAFGLEPLDESHGCGEMEQKGREIAY